MKRPGIQLNAHVRDSRRAFLKSGGQALAGGVLIAHSGGWLAAQGEPAGRRVATPVVQTAQGRLRGYIAEGVHTFKGIHYGASTGGANRFMPPQPPGSWPGVRDVVQLGERAPQGGLDIMFRTFPQLQRPEPEGEDCLCLNIWTPGVDAARRPVMVWLHGGGYSTGSGGFIAYDGTQLARHEEVVAVTLNHRLNVFGFLDVAAIGGNKYQQSSNLGLQDIIAALRWIQVNIESFGGDPDKVTIYGQSGGGRKVSTLLAMPAAKGLFHRAIIQSGSALRQPTQEHGAQVAQAFLAHMNISSVDELQRLPMAQIRHAVQTAPRSLGALGIGPVVDGKWLPTQLFDPVAPAVSADVPLLVGNNQTEDTFFPGARLDPISDSRMRSEVMRMLHTNEAGADRVIAVYRRTELHHTPLDIVQILQTDLERRHDVRIQADRKSALGRASVYVYYFDWRSPVLGGKLKSYHTLEIPFVMQNLRSCRAMVGNGRELPLMAAHISGAWAAFARGGVPAHEGLPVWPAYDASRRATMILDTEPRVLDDPNREQREVIEAVAHLTPDAG